MLGERSQITQHLRVVWMHPVRTLDTLHCHRASIYESSVHKPRWWWWLTGPINTNSGSILWFGQLQQLSLILVVSFSLVVVGFSPLNNQKKEVLDEFSDVLNRQASGFHSSLFFFFFYWIQVTHKQLKKRMSRASDSTFTCCHWIWSMCQPWLEVSNHSGLWPCFQWRWWWWWWSQGRPTVISTQKAGDNHRPTHFDRHHTVKWEWRRRKVRHCHHHHQQQTNWQRKWIRVCPYYTSRVQFYFVLIGTFVVVASSPGLECPKLEQKWFDSWLVSTCGARGFLGRAS